MFILGEVLDPLQQLPLNAPMGAKRNNSIDDHIVSIAIPAVVQDDRIARKYLAEHAD